MKNMTTLLRGLTLIILFSMVFAVDHYAQGVNRSTPPELGPPPTLKVPTPQKFQLPNGLQVTVFEKSEVPVVQMNLIIRAGSVNDPAGKEGLAQLTAAMLDEGAAGKSALDLADAIDYLGATVSAGGGLHTSTVSLRTPLSKLAEALPLYADVVLRPDFPAKELERLRKERLTSLAQAHDQPLAIASVALGGKVFGTEHPYGKNMFGIETALRSITVEDLKTFYRNAYVPNNAELIVVGAMKGAEIRKTLESAFERWKKGAWKQTSLPAAEQVSARTITIVHKPGAPQSVIRIGRIGAARMTDDYFPLLVMNTILGGSFTSRLNMNLRERNGFTYGAGSSFDFRPVPGPFVASSSVQTEVTDKAMTEFMNELRAILEPVTEEELNRAKNYLALGYPSDFQSVGQIASQIGEVVIYGLPGDYFNSYIGKVLAVTGKDVQRVARKYLDPEKIAIVIVGDREKIEEGLKRLGLGPIEVVSVEHVLGTIPVL